ncbi:Do family serine endopeptidase [Psychrobacter sp.]|uniref:Do family serine endopeptidase n=1 Tax=Psychrobacter sp. TaxID=56811 RepID=UPI0025FC7293|nr:Do family serine endopeptidase [Psychrobacter sp.]
MNSASQLNNNHAKEAESSKSKADESKAAEFNSGETDKIIHSHPDDTVTKSICFTPTKKFSKIQQGIKSFGAASMLVFSSFGTGAVSLGGLTQVGLGAILTTGAIVATVATPSVAHAAIVASDFSDLVEQVTPSVVRVNVVTKISEEELAKAQTVELLRQFFGDRIRIPGAQSPAIEYNYGTGFFVTSDGYILTNHHVIAGADKITVTLNDRTELDATLVGSDERSDVAVLKVKATPAKSYPALPMGNSNEVRVGEPVLAIGSPFGFDYSASAGIVSAKSRNFSRDISVPFIQSDVALNPGNSGGPLFNRNGQVIGINSRIFSGTGGYMGLSFSIPINEALDIYQQLKQTGVVLRPYLGIFPQDIDRNLAEAYGLSKPQGALLIKVTPNSPAQAAGLQAGDIITQYNGKMILESSDLLNIINRSKPGDTFNAIVLRKGQQLTINGKIASAPDEVSPDSVVTKSNNSQVRLGLRIQALPKESLAQLGGEGVLITEVDPTGLAARAGLRPGDVITNFHQKSITSIDDFQRALSQLPEKGVVTIEVVRQGIPAVIGIRLD